MATRWAEEETIRSGTQILELIDTKNYRTLMEGRLSAGFIDTTRSRVEQLRLQSGGKASSRSALASATVSQGDAMKLGSELVIKMRQLIRTGAPDDKALWRAFGVGKKIDATVKSVRNALDMLVDGIVKNQNKALAAGLLPSDLDTARVYATALDDADATQEGKKVKKGLSTTEVKAMLVVLKKDLTHLVSVAEATLAPDVAARFAAALPSSPATKKKVP